MDDFQTSTGSFDADDSLLSSHPLEAEFAMLVLLWSREEPDRVGEVVHLPARGAHLLGRGTRALIRQRPGQNRTTGPLRSRRISKEQLSLQRRGAEVSVRNVGRRTMRINGHERTEARLLPGDIVEIDRELLLLCALRPQTLPAADAVHPFGAADVDGIVGESPTTWRLRAQLAACAASGVHVILWGESGTGKELAARSIHRRSAVSGPLIARNAATFPEGLLDAELFGNQRNYPNAGMPERAGAIGEADGGTLFLDEIGEISHAMQAHLLRVLDAGEYQRLGESRPRQARFRTIGATNRPLESLKHDFRARFPRSIILPDLNSRRSDIPLIARHLLQDIARRSPGLFPDGVPRLHPRLVQGITLRRYTTHVRELLQILWEAIERWQLSGGKYLDLTAPQPAPPPRDEPRPSSEISREEILAAYRASGGVQARVVEALRLKNRFQLRRLEARHNITAEDRSRALSAPPGGQAQ